MEVTKNQPRSLPFDALVYKPVPTFPDNDMIKSTECEAIEIYPFLDRNVDTVPTLNKIVCYPSKKFLEWSLISNNLQSTGKNTAFLDISICNVIYIPVSVNVKQSPSSRSSRFGNADKKPNFF